MLLLALLTFTARASWDSIDRLTELLEALEDKVARGDMIKTGLASMLATATCTPKYSVGHCQMCTDSTQCEGADVTVTSGTMKGFQGAYCCSQAKICLTMPGDTCEGVTNPPNAECSPRCNRGQDPATCTCENVDFPSNWAAPTCTSTLVSSPVQAPVATPVQAPTHPTQSTADQKLAAAQAAEEDAAKQDPCATEEAYICVKMCSHCMDEACWKDESQCPKCMEGLCLECGPHYLNEGCFPMPASGSGEGDASGSGEWDASGSGKNGKNGKKNGKGGKGKSGKGGKKDASGSGEGDASGSGEWDASGSGEFYASGSGESDASGSGESGSGACNPPRRPTGCACWWDEVDTGCACCDGKICCQAGWSGGSPALKHECAKCTGVAHGSADSVGSGESGSICETEAAMNCVDQCSFCMACEDEECKPCHDEPCKSCGEYMACFPPPGATDDLEICEEEAEEAGMCVRLCGHCVDSKVCPDVQHGDCPECTGDKCDCLNDYVQCAFAAL